MASSAQALTHDGKDLSGTHPTVRVKGHLPTGTESPRSSSPRWTTLEGPLPFESFEVCVKGLWCFLATGCTNSFSASFNSFFSCPYLYKSVFIPCSYYNSWLSVESHIELQVRSFLCQVRIMPHSRADIENFIALSVMQTEVSGNTRNFHGILPISASYPQGLPWKTEVILVSRCGFTLYGIRACLPLELLLESPRRGMRQHSRLEPTLARYRTTGELASRFVGRSNCDTHESGRVSRGGSGCKTAAEADAAFGDS